MILLCSLLLGKDLPITNNCLDQISWSFRRALQLYHTRTTTATAVMAIIVRPGEIGLNSDIQLLQKVLEEKCLLKVILIPMDQIRSFRLEEDRRLLFHQTFEIGLVYWRAGYDFSDYHDEEEEELVAARIRIEQSIAIKCPDIRSQLVGMKKVQQVLTEEGVVER